jgi:hypothetical protein
MKPWMSYQEISLVTSCLLPEHTMLEWGSGGSTVTFSPLVKNYYSIEHVEEWYKDVDKSLTKNKLKVNNNLVKPDKPRTIPTKYEEFKTYIEYPKTFDVKFDRVLIDGRARVQCAEYIIPYLNDNALVLVHDFWKRPQYHSLLNLFTEAASIVTGQSLTILKVR